MEIKVGETFIISSDEYNWILKEKKVSDPNHHLTKTAEPTERFVVVGYFGNIEQLSKNLLERHLKASESDSIQNLIKTIQQTENLLKVEINQAINGEKS